MEIEWAKSVIIWNMEILANLSYHFKYLSHVMYNLYYNERPI